MLSNIQYWEQFIVYFFIFLKPVSNQGLACYKCMTTNAEDDGCRDPFSSLINPVQVNCQATSVGKNGTFPARFCVKISGRILGIDDGGNNSFLNTIIYYRTCVVDNIMESTKSLESSGNFRLKNFPDMSGSIRLQGVMSLCAFDGCNSAQTHIFSLSIILTELSVRRTSASSAEDFSGDKYSSSKARNQNTHTTSEVPYDTTGKIDSNDTHKNDFDSTFDTKSWFTDGNSDQKQYVYHD
ncbi:unnamed protein product [Adineta steineri]|uniref:Uncharacterized protein n=1 Tax=Adineta steineri TaxID=433720 RepID=A0A815HQM9_9BILA|nr:unnamed protein product [Adineta steineri]CAF1353804.1 unnamed protein product [Adineta steineri]